MRRQDVEVIEAVIVLLEKVLAMLKRLKSHRYDTAEMPDVMIIDD